MGTTEITNSQYAEFLNAKARVDTFSLYDQNMAFSRWGGITQSIVNNAVTYTVKPNMGNKPVNWVDWFDAARFVNWMHNGQGIGATETGAYTLFYNAADPAIPLNANSISRNGDAKWWLPSENEWYKAAYHQPASQGGDSDDYWLYPTATNTPPILATANSVGDISNPGPRVANFASAADWNSLNGNVTSWVARVH